MIEALSKLGLRSSFRSSFGGEVKKGLEYGSLIVDVLLADLRVDLAHGGDIRPAAGAHGYLLGNTKVVGETGEGTAKAVDTDFRQTIGAADAVDGLPDLIGVAGIDIRAGLIGLIHGGTKLRQEKRNGAPGGAILVLFTMNENAVFILNGRAMDIDAAIVQIDILPLQCKYFRAAEGGKSQKGGYLTAFAVNGIQKDGDLLSGQEGKVIGNHLGETDGDLGAGAVKDHSGEKAPGIFQGLGRAELGLLIDGTLPFVRGGGNVPAEAGLKPGTGYSTIATDGGGGENILTIPDIAVHSIGKRSFAGEGCGLLGTGLESHGFLDTFFLRWLCDGNGAAIQLDTDIPGARGELAGLGEFHFLPCLSGASLL